MAEVDEETGEVFPAALFVPKPGGLDVADLRRQASIMRKASENSPVRQFRYWFADLAEAFERCVQVIDLSLEADSELELAVELAGSLTPGMRVVTEYGPMKLSRIMRRDGDWSLHLVITDPGQLEFTGRKRDVYENLAAAGMSPVVVWA